MCGDIEGPSLETFLRGMETAHRMRQRLCVQSALKPSLEGWKPFIPVPLKLLWKDLETFLRGMETVERYKNAPLQGMP